MEIGIELAGARTVEAAFEKFPEAARQRLIAIVQEKTDELEAMVRGAVPKKTGKLAAEIESRTYDSPKAVTGIVAVSGEVRGDFGKAGALEYGSHRAVKLQAHMMKLDHLFGKMMEPMRVLVQAHDRQTNIQAHDFLRGPLAELSAGFVRAVDEAVAEATQE